MLPTSRPSHRPPSSFQVSLPPLPIPQGALGLAELIAEVVPGVPAGAGGGAAQAGRAGAEDSARLGAGAGRGEKRATRPEDHAEGEAGAEERNLLPIGLAVRSGVAGDVG